MVSKTNGQEAGRSPFLGYLGPQRQRTGETYLASELQFLISGYIMARHMHNIKAGMRE